MTVLKSKKKKEQNQTPATQSQQPEQGADLDSEARNDEGDSLIEIESHAVKEKESGGFLNSIKNAGDSLGLWDDDKPAEKEKKDGRGRPSKSKSSGQDDLASLSVALITLILSLSNIPHDVKPNDSEVTIFSKHLTGIMIRHLPIAGKFSADGMDIIGMIAVLSSWYARVQPVIEQRKSIQQESVAEIPARDNFIENEQPPQSAASLNWLMDAANTKASPA